MKQLSIILFLFAFSTINAQDSTNLVKSPFVDFDQFEALVKEVKTHRESRLITIEMLNEMSQQDDVIILDTRSKKMYDARHIKGAVHLNFSDFTQASLDALLGAKDVRVIIYCNNNFLDDQIYFPTKSRSPAPEIINTEMSTEEKPLTLALNIPTYINLYGYGYKNVYELGELISVNDPRVKLERTKVILK
ncbi:MAG: rhodanese-like domain-containing protein [Crocinitomicaceae bacterium]|nr:rhodanese-like domain-containing protein [Crocinitomicaceae bacterium]